LFFVRREKINYTIPVNSDMCRVIRKLTFKVFEVKKKKKKKKAKCISKSMHPSPQRKEGK
jgi:hypothetical protein